MILLKLVSKFFCFVCFSFFLVIKLLFKDLSFFFINFLSDVIEVVCWVCVWRFLIFVLICLFRELYFVLIDFECLLVEIIEWCKFLIVWFNEIKKFCVDWCFLFILCVMMVIIFSVELSKLLILLLWVILFLIIFIFFVFLFLSISLLVRDSSLDVNLGLINVLVWLFLVSFVWSVWW